MINSLDLWDYTSDEICEMAPRHVAVQPVASVEQHGPHLPLGTDSMIANAFAERLRERFRREDYPALFLPLMPYGKSNEHIRFPGTVTCSAQTYMSILLDIGRSCARAGFRKLVFLSTHGGNREVLDVMTREIRLGTGLHVFALQPSLVPAERDKMGCALTPEELEYGIHGGRVETSAILATHPELVQRGRMQTSYPDCFGPCDFLGFSGQVSFGWTAGDVSQTGTVGNPVGATAAEGEAWLSNVADETYRVFLEILRFHP